MTTSATETVARFFSQYSTKKYKKGQLLILSSEEHPTRIYYLLSGNVKQYDVSYRGDEIVVNVFKPRAFFPVLNAITDLPNTYIYEAATDIELVDAPASDVITFLEDNPDVTFDLLARLYTGVDGLLKRMAHLMNGSTKGRIIYEILLEVRRFGKVKPDGTYVVSVTESDIAARTGLTRETVSREIKKLKQRGILEQHKHIVIKDRQTLEQELGKSL